METPKIGFWTIIGNEQPTSFSLTDIEWELAEWYYGETEGDEFFKPGLTEEQRHYLNNLHTAIEAFQSAAKDLRFVFEQDSKYSVDVNDYINTPEYPMQMSFDEFEIDLTKWADACKLAICLKTYIPTSDPINPMSQAHKS